MLFLSDFQKAHRAWLDANYPSQLPEVPVVGMIEEAGELLHCTLKMLETQCWGEDKRYPPNKLLEEAEDAVGDCIIYACSMCNAMCWDFEAVWRDADRLNSYEPPITSNNIQCIDLVEIAASNRAPYRRYKLVTYLTCVMSTAGILRIDPVEALRRTWDRVRVRRRR